MDVNMATSNAKQVQPVVVPRPMVRQQVLQSSEARNNPPESRVSPSANLQNVGGAEVSKVVEQEVAESKVVVARAEITNDALERLLEEANRQMNLSNRRIEHSVHEKTNTILIRVRNTETGELIRELPPEDRLDAAAKVWELMGLMVDNII